MRPRSVRALMLGMLVASGGCAAEGVPRGPAGNAFVPRAVEQFSADAANSSRARISLTAEGHPEEAWQPTETIRRVDATAGPVDSVSLASGAAPVPPAPPAPDETGAAGTSVNAAAPANVHATGGRPIDLGTALALVAGQNTQVSFARARAQEAYASLDTAEALWLPSLQAGVSYHHHDGQLQDVGGRVLNINRSSLNGGFGTGAAGAGSVPTPGLVMNFHAADAYFGPEIARRTAWASRHAVDATVNDQLLEAALAYLTLLEAHQRLSIALATQENIDSLARITGEFATSGQGLQADADRTATEQAIRRNQVAQAEESIAVASARLAELLRLDPSTPIVPGEEAVLPIRLVEPASDARSLVAGALATRPELREQRALVEAACQRLQREKYAPLVPSVLLGASYSGFGGGIGSDIDNFGDRTDFDALAFWQVRGLGFGERAARAEASARIDQARFRQLQTMDRVAREVVEAKAQLDARGRQIDAAADAVQAAENSYRLNRQRILEAQGLPIETLQAVQALDAARREYLRAVTDFNEAQFRLHRALGWPIHG
ncbi:MAG: TolC family protein [Planctomycetota bacterium]|nr:TolC family protein [Planctomycetaceae bacterium]MDQ3329468.1 TolC family protein [Planctomycetota bacterium]